MKTVTTVDRSRGSQCVAHHAAGVGIKYHTSVDVARTPKYLKVSPSRSLTRFYKHHVQPRTTWVVFVFRFSPPVRKGLLDFMSAASLFSSPLLLLGLLNRVCRMAASTASCGRRPQLPAPDGSVPRRTSTASSGRQCSPPDLSERTNVKRYLYRKECQKEYQKICQKECQKRSQKECQKKTSENMPEPMSEGMPEGMSADMPDRMPE